MTTCPASASAEHAWTRLPSEPQHWLDMNSPEMKLRRKHPSATYTFDFIFRGKHGDRFKLVMLPARSARCTAASKNKRARHRKGLRR